MLLFLFLMDLRIIRSPFQVTDVHRLHLIKPLRNFSIVMHGEMPEYELNWNVTLNITVE